MTRILSAQTLALTELRSVGKAMALVCADVWRRYGGLRTVGKTAAAIRKDITASIWYTQLDVDGTIRAETTKDVVNDILTYKAAAAQQVRQAIARRTSDKTDSDGAHHGKHFGAVLIAYSDQQSATGQQRNKLHALEKRHREAGRLAKADRIRNNNLGRRKLDARRERAQQHLRTIAYQAVHAVVDKAATVVSEDLALPIKSKVQWRTYNRRMSSWAKGILAQSLEEVCEQRGACHCQCRLYVANGLVHRLAGRQVDG